MNVEFTSSVDQADVQAVLSKLNHPEAVVQRFGESGYFIRTKTLEEEKQDSTGNITKIGEREAIVDALADISSIESFEFASVSPVVAAETVRNAVIAVVVASIAILLYITWAFRKVPSPLRYGVSAVVALLHDVIIVMGIYSIISRFVSIEVNTMFITGMLTVVGYSVNDTVVVFDRIRENIYRSSGVDLGRTVNNSLLESLGRSLNTSMTTLVVITALLLFGGASIRPLIVVMFIGIIAGAYSSIGIASTLLVSWEKGDIGRLLRRIPLVPAAREESSVG